jgi:predicted nucleic acid-binding protein
LSYLIDTDWVVDWLAERRTALQLLRDLGREGVFVSLMTYGEVYEGILFGSNPSIMEARFNDFLSVATLLAFDEETMLVYARIRGELRRSGRPIGEGDLLIAASAIRHGAELVTRNLRDFARIPGLRLYKSS